MGFSGSSFSLLNSLIDCSLFFFFLYEKAYEVAMSPRKAFSLAMSGGLKVLCALAKWVMAMGDIFSGGVEETADLALLRMAPMSGLFALEYGSIGLDGGAE